MKEVKWIVIILAYCIGSAFCQNDNSCADLYTDAAAKMSWKGQDKESVRYYRKALSSKAFFTSKDYVNAALMFLKVDSPLEAYVCLDNAIKGGLVLNEVSQDSTIGFLLKTYPGNTLRIPVENSSNNHLTSKLVSTSIDELFKVDQFIRFEENLPFENKEMIFQVIDSTFVFKELVVLLDSICNTGNLVLEEKSRKKMVIMLRHQTGYSTQYEQVIVPKLRALLDFKIISSYEYAQIIDSHLLQKKGIQRYVTHYIYDEVTDTDLVKPIENTKAINEQRFLIGLLPLFLEIEEELTTVDFGEEGVRKGYRFKRFPIEREKKLLDEYLTTKCF